VNRSREQDSHRFSYPFITALSLCERIDKKGFIFNALSQNNAGIQSVGNDSRAIGICLLFAAEKSGVLSRGTKSWGEPQPTPRWEISMG
jgi:hypothetical protein